MQSIHRLKRAYVSPRSKKPLSGDATGLFTDDGQYFPFIKGYNQTDIPNFLSNQKLGDAQNEALTEYNHEESVRIYKNFLNWLYQTFDVDEADFRENLVSKLKLKKGNKVVITGCGLGDDIPPIFDIIGPAGELHANDLAAEMMVAATYHTAQELPEADNIHFSVCDAQYLPFPDNYFDGAFHFGGINLFEDIKKSISEMERVVKPGGHVVFGDEGVAPWLRDTEYGRIAIHNNPLWAYKVPVELLSEKAVDVHVTWVLGNCFYLIDFEVSESGPCINMDVPHKGPRGGTMRTRYFGQLEGVSEKSKSFVKEDAARRGVSVHDWLEQVIREKKELIRNLHSNNQK